MLTIARAHLPLYYFDFGAGVAPGYRFFEANIPALDDRLLQNRIFGSVVVIARVNQHPHQLCAIEKVQKSVYSLTRLHAWVKLADFKKADDCQPPPIINDLRHDELQPHANLGAKYAPWWSSAALRLRGTPCPQPLQQKRQTSSRVVKSAKGALEDPLRHGDPPDTPTEVHPDLGPHKSLERDSEPHTPSSIPLEIHQDIVRQYLDSLYLSKASFAFFAKGPLSRARAVYLKDPADQDARRSLAGNLRLMILTANNMDKKYRSKLRETLKSLGEAGLNSNSAGSNVHRPNNAKISKRVLKPGRDGTYPIEHDFIAKWWDTGDPSHFSSVGDENLNCKLAQLRSRESLLQIILILEVMAIESALVPPTSTTSHPETQETQASSIVVRKKPKRPQDLALSLDLLLDRLCIWQSVELPVHQFTGSPTETLEGNTASGSDGLREFCLEVIIPLYSSRLPAKVKEIAGKIGVTARSPHPKPPRDPGAAVGSSRPKTAGPAPGKEIPRKTPTAKQPHHRAIQRISTDTPYSRRPSSTHGTSQRPPALTRSSTDPLLPDPASATRRRTLSRTPSLTASKKLAQREIDMSAIQRFNEAKSRKKAAVEQELASAIDKLKKPKRREVAREYVEEVEGRGKRPRLDARSASGVGGAHSTRGAGVQVGATPRKDRSARGRSQTQTQNIIEPGNRHAFAVPDLPLKYRQPQSHLAISSGPSLKEPDDGNDDDLVPSTAPEQRHPHGIVETPRKNRRQGRDAEALAKSKVPRDTGPARPQPAPPPAPSEDDEDDDENDLIPSSTVTMPVKGVVETPRDKRRKMGASSLPFGCRGRGDVPATPTGQRRRIQPRLIHGEDAVLESSPIAQRSGTPPHVSRKSGGGTPRGDADAGTAEDDMPSSPPVAPVRRSPPRAADTRGKEDREQSSGGAKEREKSVYEMLGWDDDGDTDELLKIDART